MKYILIFIGGFLLSQSLSAQVQLNGAGATFPYVLYSKWFDVHYKKTGIQFNYQSIGSGGGIKQIIEGTVDFGATDGPMTDEQLAEAKRKQGTNVIHVPMALGAVVVIYNLPGVGPDLKMTPDVLVDIFLGKITSWNDTRIQRINPDRKLPKQPILVVHRSDGSGTTFIFVDYLTKMSDVWEKKVGKGTSVRWPVGLGGKGNEGIAGQVKQMPGSIGYVELAYAVKNNLPYMSVQNASGNFVRPTLASVTAAAMSEAEKLPDDFRVSITNAEGKDSYSISGFTWLLVYEKSKDKTKGKALIDFLRWALRDGQKYTDDLLYAPLPEKTVRRVEERIATLN